MKPSQRFIDFIIAQVKNAGDIKYKRMFGGCCLYCDQKIVALIDEDKLFVKPTAAGRKFLGGKVVEKSPYPSAKLHFVLSGPDLNNHTWLQELIEVTSNSLPLPKKKEKT